MSGEEKYGCPVCNWEYDPDEWDGRLQVPAHNFPKCEGAGKHPLTPASGSAGENEDACLACGSLGDCGHTFHDLLSSPAASERGSVMSAKTTKEQREALRHLHSDPVWSYQKTCLDLLDDIALAETELSLIVWLSKAAFWEEFPQAEEMLHEWALGSLTVEQLRNIKEACCATKIQAVAERQVTT